MGTGKLTWLAAVLAGGFAVAEQPPPAFTVCIDYGCDFVRKVLLGPADWRRVEDLFAGDAGPAAERAAVARAVGILEDMVGSRAGTAGDAPGNSALFGTKGQLDCVAESMNTDTYLQLLDQQGLLTHHRPAGRRVRHRWFFDTHWTAVLEEHGSGRLFAIDSWPGANGDPAAVVALDSWHLGQYANDSD